MTNSGLTASDVLAMTRNDGNDSSFGGVGAFILLFIFLMALSGNGFGFGNNGVATSLGQSDLQNSLYFQSQDNAIRSLANGQCALTDTILNSKYDTALMLKDASQQLSNSVASLGNLVTQENQATRNMIMQNKIDMLNDQIVVLRGQNSNLEQTANLTGAISNQTSQILNSLGRYRTFPPCYENCGCSSLY